MKKLLAGVGAALIFSSLPVAAADNEGWIPIGFDRKTGVAASWIKARNAEQVNEDSFKVFFRDHDGETLATVNCKNQDIFFKGYKGWNQLSPGTGWYEIGDMLCRHFPIRTKWGYEDAWAHLWNAPEPPGQPGDSTGEWIEFSKSDSGESYINADVKTDGKVALYATFDESKQQDDGTGTKRDSQSYGWVLADCTNNRYSYWIVAGGKYIKGRWSAPKPGRPNGTAQYVRKNFCSKPNTTFATLPLPTIESMRRYAD